jgi:hypothetical protein
MSMPSCALGGSLRREGKRAEAASCYRDAQFVDPTNPYALGNHIAEDLLERRDVGGLELYRPLTEGVAERCRRQVEARVNLPWALFDLGIFELYLAWAMPTWAWPSTRLGPRAPSTEPCGSGREGQDSEGVESTMLGWDSAW